MKKFSSHQFKFKLNLSIRLLIPLSGLLMAPGFQALAVPDSKLPMASPSSEYSFKYEWNHQRYEIRKPALNYESALEIAAQDCFNFFKNKRSLTIEQGQELIDVCVNPHR